jgi:hypothetical protein
VGGWALEGEIEGGVIFLIESFMLNNKREYERDEVEGTTVRGIPCNYIRITY